MKAGRRLFLIIDQGGHASRAIVFDDLGAVRARTERAVHERRHAERVELGAAELWRSIQQVVAAARRKLGRDAGRVKAAGLVTQRSTIACWDRLSGRPLSPVLSWQDRRAAQWLQLFLPHAQRIAALTGLRLSPHYGAGKFRWCIDHLPSVRKAIREGRLAIGPLASFLLFKLTRGRSLSADPANAARTLLYNPHRGDWDPELLELFGLNRQWLPQCRPTRAEFGTLQWGRDTVPIKLLSGDQSTALFGYGEPDPAAVYVNIGTGAFLQRPLRGDWPADRRGLLASIVYSDRRRRISVLEGTVNGAASAITAMALKLKVARVKEELSGWLTAEKQPPLFLNGIGGLGSPFWRADFRSRFIGRGSGRAKMVAVVESIVFLIALNVDLMDTLLGPARRIIISGGVAQLNGLCSRLAVVTGRKVERPPEGEASARGAAFLLSGRRGDWSADGCDISEPATNAALCDRYARFRDALERNRFNS